MYAKIETTKGTITLELAYEKAPLTVMNFIGLAEGKMVNGAKPLGEPYFDGIKFHRVVPNFVIQGGDPKGIGSGGPGYQFDDEFHEDLTHNRAGVLSMANAGPGTNGSQFFITHNATPHLDFKHSVFGFVTEGQEVVDAIREGDVMKSVTILRAAGEDFECTIEAWQALKASAKERLQAFRQKQADAQRQKNLLREEGIAKAQAGKETYKTWLKEYATKLSNGLEVKEAGDGLFYFVSEEGDGTNPVSGDKVNAKYKGYYPGGQQFDAGTYEFELVNAPVIDGWHVGFAELSKGAKATLVIPYWLGYGDRNFRGMIPGYSTLVFEVEVLSIR